jgi:hypothetical protein
MGKKKRDPSARAQKNTVKLSFLVIIALSGIGTWRDFDLLYLCLVLNVLALVLNVLAENLDALKCWWLGVFIAPTTKMVVGEGCCRRAHRPGLVHCLVRLLAPALTLHAQSRTVHCCFCRRPLTQLAVAPLAHRTAWGSSSS